MLAKTLFASAASVAVFGLFAVSMPAAAQKAPRPAAGPEAGAVMADVQADYRAMGEELGLKGNQQAAFDRYAQAVAKAEADHVQWHEANQPPRRGDRQARVKHRADHEQFRAQQFETLAGARAELIKGLNADQVALLDEMEDGYRFAPAPGPRRGYGFGPGPRGPRGYGYWGPHHRWGGWGPCWDGYGPRMHHRRGPGCAWGGNYGYGPGYGAGYGPGSGWGCPWR